VILTGAGAIATAYTLVTAVAYFMTTGVPFPVLLAGLVTLPVSPLCLWASRRGQWRLAALPVVLALLAVTIYGQYTFGEHDVSLILYAALVIIAGIAYGGRVAMGAAMMCVLSYGAVGYLRLRGLLPAPAPAGLLPQVITIGTSLAIIVFTQWLFIGQLQDALRRSRTLAEELRKHRDHLEELVHERTANLQEANARLQQQITERKQAEAEKERALVAERAQAQRQAALLRLSAELAGTLEENEICQRVARGLRDTLGYDFVGLFFIEDSTGDRVLAAHVGFDQPPTRLVPGQGVSERPFLDGQLHYTADVSQDPRYIPGMGGSEVDVPVRVGEDVLGVLIAERAQINAFSTQDLEVLTAAANQAGLAIGRARLLAAERERADQLDALRTTMTEITTELDLPTLLQAIVERARGLLNATGGELGLYEQDSQQVRIVVSRGFGQDYVGTCHKLGQGGMGRVAETGESLIIADYQTWEGRVSAYAHIHSSVIAPLEVGGRLVGVIAVASTDPAQQFGDTDLHLLELFAQQAAIAIDNAGLYDQAQQEIAERQKAETEKERLLMAERAQAKRQAALLRLSAELAATLEERDVCQRVVDGLHDTLGYDFVALFLVDETTGDRLLAATLESLEDQAPTRIPPGEGLSEDPLLDGQLHYTPDVSQDPRYIPGLGGSEVDVPIRIEDQVRGVLNAESQELDAFTPEDLEVLTAAAHQAGLAIGKARLLAAERQRVEELDALRTTMADITAELELPTLLQAIVERAKALLNVDAGELGLYDEVEQRVRIVVSHEEYVGTHHKLGEGAMGRVAATGEPLVIEDYQTWEGRVQQYAQLHASLSAPLQVRGQLVGVISVASTDPDRQFEDADLRLLNLFAHQAAIAIENARLFTETERHAAEMATLTEIGKALSSTLRVDEVVKLIYEQTRRVIPGEDMIIQLHDEERDEIECAFSTNPEDIVVGARFPADTGVSGYIIQHGKSVLLRDKVLERMRDMGIGLIGIPPESALAVPILMGDRVLGVILVQHYTTPGVYDESHRLLLETIASQAAIAIENARLYDQAQREIAERVRAEEELRKYQEHLEELVEERTAKLRESEERYRTLFDGVPVGMYRTTPVGQIVDANPAWAQMLGLPAKQALRDVTTSSFYVNPADRQRWQKLMEHEGVVRDFEVQARRSDGTVIWITDTARAVRDDQGQVLYYEGSIEDISERKQAEEELRKYREHLEELVEERTAKLRESEERYRTLFDGVPVGLYRTTPAGQTLDFNRAAVQMFGFPTREVALASSPEDSYADPRDRPRWQTLMEREGLVRDFEYQVRTYDGGDMWVSDSARAVKDEQGHVLYYEGSLEDITERKRAEEELQRAKEAAEAANQAKSRFLANMSHELRTPLNAIIGFTRLVQRRSQDVLPQKQLDNLDKVLISADHLLGLINDVLDLSKIEAGRTEVQPASFALEPLVDACLQQLRPLVRTEKLRLVKQIEPDLPTMFSDQDKLRQILINLLSNAAKFTEEGSITVSAWRENDALVLAVADTGIGIPEDALERIFEAFQQVDTSTTRRYGGTGLGLSISRQLAQLLGGDITVESEIGSGSTFTVAVPIHYAPIPSEAASAPVRETSPEVVSMKLEGGPVVLAIDDDPNVIYLLQENLGEAGYRVVGVTNGDEGLRKARELKPFAITLDILMSPKDGWQILHELKADEVTRDIPVVVLSIVDNQELGYRLGASDYLMKPFDREAILGTLARIAPTPATPRQVRLLVVDDDPQVVDLVSQLLEDQPYTIEDAKDGEEALDAVSRRRPDIILLDLLMPRLDGFGVIEQLHRRPEYREIPIIVLTAKALSTEELGQLQQTVSKVIQKRALERDMLLQELRHALHAYRESTASKGS
jgi:PAS domain S-box-containing protein